MGRISTGIGLISGINSKDIIDQLMALEARPKNLLQVRIDQTNQQKLAYTDLSTRLTALKLAGTNLKKTLTFQATSASSSDQNVLTATASAGAPRGSYQLQVSRLVTSQQSVTRGFESETSRVGAGTITLELGGGELYSQTQLAQLNGGAGVRRGSFRITDGTGKSAVIDISTALTLDDVVRKINTSLDVGVRAEVVGNALKLTDLSSSPTGEMVVADLVGGYAAADLGIAGTSSGGVLSGSVVNYVGRATALSSLNDGRGVRVADDGADFRITAADGSTYDVTLGSVTTVGGVIDAINTATGGQVAASVSSGESFLRLTDNTSGAGPLALTALSSEAAADLGIEQSVMGNMAGNMILASIDTVLLSSLRGGTGLTQGTFTITDRTGASAVVDTSSARTVQDVIDRINAADVSVLAKLKSSGNGIELIDQSGGNGNLIVTDVDSTTAAELGIAGVFGAAVASVHGANMQRQWASETTMLSTYNGGRSVAAGRIKITNSLGQSAQINLMDVAGMTLGDVIEEINSARVGESALNVAASINANGDGLLLTDAAGGALTMKVEEVDSTTAADLNIKGSAAAGIVDGSFEKTISVDATDTLADVQQAINALGFALVATILNDGSGTAPYRLSLTARNSGRAGRVIFDAGETSLDATTLVESQDAVVFYGGGDPTRSLPVTSPTNKITGLIKGVTIDLHGVSASPVALSVTENLDGAINELNQFAQNFNSTVDKLRELTDYDAETNQRGLLLGENAAQQVEAELYAIVQSVVNGAGEYRIFADVGLHVTNGAKLEFDPEKFRSAYAAHPDSVKNLFTLYRAKTESSPEQRLGLGYVMEDRIARLIDPVSGLLTTQTKALEQRTDQFQDRIEQLDQQLAAKRARLEKQFANLESVLSSLQSQQQAIASFTALPPMQTNNSSS